MPEPGPGTEVAAAVNGDPREHRVIRPGGARLARPRATWPASEPDFDQDFDAQAFTQLYSKLAATMSASQTVSAGHDSLLSLMLPGSYVEQNLDPTDDATQYLLSSLLNPTLACSWIVRRGAATVSDVYESILNGKETPDVHLSPEQKRKLDDATALLYEPDGEPTAFYAEYLEDSLAYLTALDAFEQAEATASNGGPPVPPEIRRDLDAAAARWREHGHLYDVDRALATISELEALEPELYWRQLARRYRDSTRYTKQDSVYQHTESIPPYPRWFDDEGWTSFHFDERDITNQDRSGGVGVGDCCCCCQDGVRPAAYGGFHSTATDFSAGLRLPAGAPTKFVLAVKLRRVEIMRPWLDPLVLRSRAWRWYPASPTYGVVVCSGGNLPGSVVPTGVMPMLPTTALVARDLEIDWSGGGKLAAAMAQSQTLGQDLRFGPFLLSRATISDGHISAPDPQLFGFLSELLPRSPDPDLRLPWPRH